MADPKPEPDVIEQASPVGEEAPVRGERPIPAEGSEADILEQDLPVEGELEDEYLEGAGDDGRRAYEDAPDD